MEAQSLNHWTARVVSRLETFRSKVDMDGAGTLSWEQEPECLRCLFMTLFFFFFGIQPSAQFNYQLYAYVRVLRPGISGRPSLLPPLFTSLNYSNLGALLKIAE